jgi:PAS domain S-box-containing protein
MGENGSAGGEGHVLPVPPGGEAPERALQHAIDALRESEDRYHRLVDSVTDYIYTVRVEGGRAVSTHHGPGCLGVTGFTSGEYAADPHLWHRMVHEEDRGLVLEQARRILADEPVGALEHRIVHKNGTVRWVRNTPVPHRDREGRLVAYDGLVTDITERCEAEQSLREAVEQFRTILEATTDGFRVTDTEGRILEVNAVYCRLSGHTREELLGMRSADFAVGDGPDETLARLSRIAAGGSDRFETRHRTRDGRVLDVEVSATAVPRTGKFLTFVRDITAHRRAEQALRDSEERFRTLFEHATDGIVVIDLEGTIVDCNRRLCDNLGYAREELLGKPAELLYPPEAAAQLPARMTTIQERGEAVFEGSHRRRDGSAMPVEINTRLLMFQGQAVYFSLVRDVTERRRAEDVLRRREAEFRGLFENSPTSLWLEDLSAVRERLRVLRATGVEDLDAWFDAHPEELPRCAALARVLDVNRASVLLYHARGKEELLEGFTRTFTAESFAGFRRALLHLAAGDTAFSTEAVTRTLDGERLFCLIEWSVLPGFEESHAKVIVSITDITERKRQEDLLRRIADELLSKTGEEYFAALTEFVARELRADVSFVGRYDEASRQVRTIAVFAHGRADGNFVYDLEGTPCEQVVGREACFHPRGVSTLFPRDERALHLGIESYAGVPLFASDGAPLGLFVIMGTAPMAEADRRRIFSLLRVFAARAAAELERREAEESLRRSEVFIRNIVDSVDEAFLVIDRDYRIVSCNRAYFAQSGRDAAACVGKYCYEVAHRRSAPCWEAGEECAVRRTFETGEPNRCVHEHINASGEVVRVESKSFALRGAGGTVAGAIEIVNDITDRLRLEDQLRQAQKMEAVGLLAGGVAHDFNNILSAIIGYGNLLELKLPPESPFLPYVGQILSAAERAARLTQSLLAFSRKQIINPKALDVNEVIRTVGKLLTRVMGEDVELRTRLAPGTLVVFADAGQLEQVFMNLATNARDAMPGGGVFTLETEPFTMDEAFVAARGYGRPGDYALVTVADTGVGMDQQVLARIFEPFFTTKELGRGTGLGLAMVYGVVQQNEGHISVASDPGRGTTFRIYLPLVLASQDPGAAAVSHALIGGSETILLAEDDAVVRQLCSVVLREFGYTVVEALDGAEAVELFRARGGKIDLCILDVIMPRMNGKEAYEEIRRLRPGAKALFVSGYTADIVHRKGILQPDMHFLCKPVSPQDLLAKIREVLSTA